MSVTRKKYKKIDFSFDGLGINPHDYQEHYDFDSDKLGDLYEVRATCSMEELGTFNHIIYKNLKKEYGPLKILNLIKQALLKINKCIIYNVNYTKGSKNYKDMIELGFKEVYTYKGNNGQVRVLMLSKK